MTPKFPLCLFGLLLCGSSTFAADIPDYPFIFVTGSAESEAPPNIAVCSLTIRAVDLDPGKAEATVGNRLTSALAVLAAIRGYDLSRSLHFKVRQLTSLPAIEDGFVGSPNVEQINCQFDRTDRAALEADLLTKAIHSAKDQADRLAEPLGRHVTTAAAVSKLPFAVMASVFGMDNRLAELTGMDRMFKKSVSADDLLVPSTIYLSVSVNVLFKMD